MDTVWTNLLGTQFSQRYVDAKGVRTRVVEAGDGDHLLLLHGTGGHAEAYARNLASHAAHFHVLAPDMLGHGFTDKPDRPYEVIDYVNHLRDLMDVEGVERANISGESLGGWVAARFAMEYPERINRLVLNTAGGLTAYPEVMKRIKDLSLAAVRNPTRDSVRQRLEFLMKDPSSVTEELVEIRYRVYTQPGFQRAMENLLCLQEMEVRQRNLFSPEQLAAIRAPTLVLWTTHDPTAPVEVAERYRDAIPGAQLVVMENCGHWPQWEDVDTFDQHHLSFLLAGGAGGQG